MKYISTNGQSLPVSFREAVFSSLAPDGGLYIPEHLSPLSSDFLRVLRSQSLHSIGLELVSHFMADLRADTGLDIVKKSWTFPIPLVPLEENFFLLELFHGPTLAFKDIGARFLAQALSHYLDQSHQSLTILVATSGDTGSAVAHGFFGANHTTVYVLYPSGKISRLQEQQMTTLGGNIRALEVDGTFDDCQRIVREALSDEELVRSRGLTSANSMNLGRLLPQIVYYLWAVAQWQQDFSESTDEHEGGPTIVVPSGNFGNLTAALYARALGIPIRQFLAATNKNDVVPRYFHTGTFTPRASVQTLSNAMDVGNPSNLARIQALFRNDLGSMRREVLTASISDDETINEIRRTYGRTGTVLDPHTAVGVAAARQLEDADPVIIAATAHAAKFPEVTERALGFSLPLPPSLQDALGRPKQSRPLAPRFADLKKLLTAGE